MLVAKVFESARQTYWNAAGIALAWVGAVVGPILFRGAIEARSISEGIVSLVLLIVVVVAIREGVQAIKRKQMLLAAVSTVLPGILLVLGISLAFMASAPSIDACLDSGGSFNDENCECDYTENHAPLAEHSCW